jgi:hypothetical protein
MCPRLHVTIRSCEYLELFGEPQLVVSVELSRLDV